ncbi:MAG: alanine racemase [Kiloniellales bacterium]
MRRRTSNPGAWAIVDLDALEYNYREIVRRVGSDVRVIASIKANAYGFGAVACAKRLEKAGSFALATGNVEEAIAVREAGVGLPILMFGGFLPADVPRLLQHNLIPTLYNKEMAETVSAAAAREVEVYVKVECGLGRLGVPLEEAFAYIGSIHALPNLRVAGVYTHLPFFDAASRARSERQLKGFDDLAAGLEQSGIGPLVTQALASSAVLEGLTDRCNAVCVGHLLYGLSPMAPGEADLSAFRPVLKEVGARLIHVGHHPAGGDIGMGGLYGIAKAMKIGVIPLGMQNGMRAPAPGKTAEVLIRGRRVPSIGVSLEHMTIDLSALATPVLEETVLVLGAMAGAQPIDLEDLAVWRSSAPLEVAMTLSDRIPTIFADGEQHSSTDLQSNLVSQTSVS